MLRWSSIQEVKSSAPAARHDGGADGEIQETREAQEARLVEQYSEAVQAQQEYRFDLAKRDYRLILEQPLLQGTPQDEILRRLKYLCIKNTAEVLEVDAELKEALRLYALATEVDGSDVVVWLHIAVLCVAVRDLRVARYAYECGLHCQHDNWECLEGLIGVLESLGDWEACLSIVNRALRIDCSHPAMLSRRAALVRWMTMLDAPAPASPSHLPSPPHMSPLDSPGGGWGSQGDAGASEEGSSGSGCVDVLEVVLEPEAKRHAWAELGKALFEDSEGRCGPLNIKVCLSGAERGHHGSGHSKRRTSRRITEEDRLEALRASATSDAAETAVSQAANAGPSEGTSAVEGSQTGKGTQGRRVSNRQQLRKEAKEETRRNETRTARQELGCWLEEHLLSGLPRDEMGAPLPVSWWDKEGDELSVTCALEIDEGSKLARKLLLPFKGVHNGDCDVCGYGGDLLCCETCSMVYHAGCLLRPPAMSQALYCDRCKEDAYNKANVRPPRVSDRALYSSQVEEICNEFLPEAEPNLGALDVMHRLVLRLVRVREPRMWEDGTVRRVALQLEEASRPFARDVQLHTCPDVASSRTDFGHEGELFLAELHLDELMLVMDHEQGGHALRTRDGPCEAHARAVDAFLAKVAAALDLQQQMVTVMEVEGKLHEADDEHAHVFSPEYVCRVMWLCSVYEGWRGHTTKAAALLKKCEEELSHVDGGRVELPHCQRHPVIDAGALSSKLIELTKVKEVDTTRRLVQAFQRGAAASKGGTPEAHKAFIHLLKTRFLMPQDIDTTRTQLAEELVTDMLQHEAANLVRKPEDATVLVRDIEHPEAAVQHHSVVMLGLFTCVQRKDQCTAWRLLFLVLEYVTRVDALAEGVTAKFLRRMPVMAAQVKDRAVHVNLLLVENLSSLLCMALAQDWPENRPIHPELADALAVCLSSLARLSTVAFSRVMLDASVAIAHAMRLTPMGPELQRLSLKCLAGVVSDTNLNPDLLLHYTNTPGARTHCHAAVSHLCNALEQDAAWGEEGALSQEEMLALACSLKELSRVGEENPQHFWATTFYCILSLTFIITKHPELSHDDKVEWLIEAHDALGELAVCGHEEGRFLKLVLSATRGAAGAEDGSEQLRERAHDATVQCVRCLYDVQLKACDDHRAAGRKPEGLQEALALAVVVLRYLEDGKDTRRKKDMLSALQLVHEEELLRTPCTALRRYSHVEDVLLTAHPKTEDEEALLVQRLLEPEEQQHNEQSQMMEVVDGAGRYEKELMDYEGMASKVQDPDTLLYVYRRLYYYLGELSLPPKFNKKKGQTDVEAYEEYERDNLWLLRIHLNDLRFNPSSLEAWRGLSDMLRNLAHTYLDHCSWQTHDPPAADAFEAALLTPVQGERKSLWPFITGYLDKSSSGYIRTLIEESGIAPGVKLDDVDMEVHWAPLVSKVYVLLTKRALRVLAALLDTRLETEPGDTTCAELRVETSLRLASLAYVCARGLARDNPEYLRLFMEVEKEARQAAESERRYRLKPRWDVQFLVGRALEKSALIRHPSCSYGFIESQVPRWMSSVLSAYQSAFDRAETKTARKDTFYRLHATRLRAVTSDLRAPDVGEGDEGGLLLQPNVALLRVLASHSFGSKREGAPAVDDGEVEGAAQGQALSSVAQSQTPRATDPSKLRWDVLQDALDAMAQCRRWDAYDHRSLHRSAKALEHVARFKPQGEALPQEAGVAAARDAMYPLFEKKRSQVVAVWLPEESYSAFEVINQRTRKYETTRMRYIEYYLYLLHRCKDLTRMGELHRNVRGLRDEYEAKAATLNALIKLLGELIEHAHLEAAVVQTALSSNLTPAALMEVVYELYLDLLETKKDAPGVLFVPTAEQMLVRTYAKVVAAGGASQPGEQPPLQRHVGSTREQQGDGYMDEHSQPTDSVPLGLPLSLAGLASQLSHRSVDVGGVTVSDELDQALEFAYSKWPGRQGRAKVAKARGRPRGRGSSGKGSSRGAGGPPLSRASSGNELGISSAAHTGESGRESDGMESFTEDLPLKRSRVDQMASAPDDLPAPSQRRRVEVLEDS